MNKALKMLYEIWNETDINWEREPYEYALFNEDDERFLVIEKVLKELDKVDSDEFCKQIIDYAMNKE